jgi:hypothetical protein
VDVNEDLRSGEVVGYREAAAVRSNERTGVVECDSLAIWRWGARRGERSPRRGYSRVICSGFVLLSVCSQSVQTTVHPALQFRQLVTAVWSGSQMSVPIERYGERGKVAQSLDTHTRPLP